MPTVTRAEDEAKVVLTLDTPEDRQVTTIHKTTDGTLRFDMTITKHPGADAYETWQDWLARIDADPDVVPA